jgi:hypothetical protein
MKEFPTSAFANAAARCRLLLQSKSNKMANIPDAIQAASLIITRYQGDRRKESGTFLGSNHKELSSAVPSTPPRLCEITAHRLHLIAASQRRRRVARKDSGR